jgi:hypothetical protein
MIARSRTKALLDEAKRLASDLGRFRTPGTSDAVDPARVAELSRFLAMKRDVLELRALLDQLPTSFHAKMSRSAPPQIQEIGRLVRPLLARVPDPEELLYVLGWAQRLMATVERGTSGEAPKEGARQGAKGSGPRGFGGRR